MARSRNGLANYLCRLVRPETDTDAELLDRFQASRDEAAFTKLVQRHGPVVYGVCARVLSNRADAEDAYQATFIVLVRQIATVDRQRPLAGWLHTIAYRTALKARLRRQQLLLLERRVPPMPPTEPPDTLDRHELCAALDEELQQLPIVERDLLILCDMQGRTHTEAAAALNCPLGSVSRLLASARERLRAGLSRRGVGVPAGLLAAVLARDGLAAVPWQLNAAAVRAALSDAPGSSGASELARQVMNGSALGRTKAVAVGLLAAVLGGAGVLGLSGVPERPRTPAAAGEPPAAAEPPVSGARTSAPVFRHGGTVTALAVAPDGHRVASAGTNRVVRVWDHETGRELIRFGAPPAGVAALAFSPDRNELLVEDPRVGLAIWSLDTGKRRKNHLGQWTGVEALAYSADGTRLATVGRNGKLVALDLTVPQSTQRENDWATKELAAKFIGRLFAPADPATRARHGYGVAFTADGGTVYAIDRDLTLARADVLTGRVEKSKLKPDPKADAHRAATAVAVAPGARWAAWGDGDKRVGLAELPSGPVHFLSGHGASVVALAFALDGRTLASVDADGHLIHTKLSGGRFESHGATFRFRATVLAVAPDGSRVYGAGADGEVHCWDATSLDPVPPVRKK